MRDVDPKIIEMLDESGVSYTLEDGARRRILKIGGTIVAVLPRSFRDVGRTVQNARSAVRRHLKGLNK